MFYQGHLYFSIPSPTDLLNSAIVLFYGWPSAVSAREKGHSDQNTTWYSWFRVRLTKILTLITIWPLRIDFFFRFSKSKSASIDIRLLFVSSTKIHLLDRWWIKSRKVIFYSAFLFLMYLQREYCIHRKWPESHVVHLLDFVATSWHVLEMSIRVEVVEYFLCLTFCTFKTLLIHKINWLLIRINN